jgi:hypothetical protein
VSHKTVWKRVKSLATQTNGVNLQFQFKTEMEIFWPFAKKSALKELRKLASYEVAGKLPKKSFRPEGTKETEVIFPSSFQDKN